MAHLGLAGSNAVYAAHRFTEFICHQQELGITNIELWAGVPHLHVDACGFTNPEPLNKELSDAGLQAVALCPRPYLYTLCAHPGGELHQASVAYYINCVRMTKIMGIPVMAMGITGGCRDLSEERSLAAALEGLREIVMEAERQHITLAIGTSPAAESRVLNSLTQLMQVLERLNSPSAAPQLDTIAAAMAGETPADWFTAFRNIAHVRFSDAGSEGCRIWGRGILPLYRWLEDLFTAGYAGPLALRLTNESMWNDALKWDRENYTAVVTALLKRRRQP